jgi:plasmid stability protein
MPRLLQVRNVPDDVHRTLKVRAAQAGLSLSDYVLRQITVAARRPTFDELVSLIQSDGSVEPSEDSAAAVRDERASH